MRGTEEVVPLGAPRAPRPVAPDADGDGPQPLLSLALAGMLEGVHAHSGALYLLPRHGEVLEMVAKAGLPRSFSAPWERVPLTAPMPVADAIRERRLIWISGEEEMARRYPRIAVVLPYPYCLAALPVTHGDTVYGAVYLTWPGSHPAGLSDAELTQLTTACERLALRLEHAAEAGQPVLPSPGVIEAGSMGPARTSGAVEAARMLARIPEGLCALDVEGRVTYASPATGDLLGLPASRLRGKQLWTAAGWLDDPVYEDRYRAAMLSQRPTSFTVLRPPRSWLTFRLYPSRNGISVHIAPAGATEGGPLPDTPPGRSGSLVTISHILSLASALTKAVGVSDVIETVADEIMPTLGSDALVMLAAENNRLRVLGQRGYRDPGIVERWDGTPMTAQIPGVQALTTGVPSFFESRLELERVYPTRFATPDGMAAWAYLPLIASGRPVGACVLGYAREHDFSTDERAVLTSLGGLIAQALERARLYDAKLRLAHGLQSSLLPNSLPLLPGLEAAARYLPGSHGMDIGGDFYDLVPVHGRAAAVIGDVQGHNATAAGLMGQVRTAVRAYTAVGQPPRQVVESTNRLLIDLDADLLTSCAYLHLDLPARRAVFARAGHPQPLLREPDGRVRVLELAGGPLLGVDRQAVYPTTEVPLVPGSILVLYTDGLIEEPGVDLDDSLGALAGRLGRLPADSLETLADALMEQPGAARRGDDTALLLLRPGP
ncbi:SpoIIE family protein phosphatase [Streptomyces sp. NPDC051018]|uniref:SpoIIE family protein phosphatase n=1 Tax=Streptomyces sp. NPDC051018 TaxID=3365639 RepID=UPI0037BA3E11